MNVILVPAAAKSFNDIINLNDCMQALMRYARKQQSKPFASFRLVSTKPACARCTCGYGLEIHHLRPVWAYALELILNHDLKGKDDERALRRECLQGSKNIVECHKVLNLNYLCEECHLKEQQTADAAWQGFFEMQYRVVFQTRNIRAIEALLNR